MTTITMTTHQAALHFNKTIATIQRWCRTGKLVAVKKLWLSRVRWVISIVVTSAPTYEPTADALNEAYGQASANEMPQAWRNALDKAYRILQNAGAVEITYDASGNIGEAHFESASRPGLIHTVNGHCDCEAAHAGRPCWHRAAKRLLQLAWDAEKSQQIAA